MSADTRGIRELAEQPTDIADRIAHNIAGAAKFSEHETCPSESVMAHVIALEIQAFAESIVEQCCKVLCEKCRRGIPLRNREYHVFKDDHKTDIEILAIGSKCEAAPIRSHWQRGEL